MSADTLVIFMSLKLFELVGVEVRLGKPLRVENRPPAGGYLRSYEVVATTVDEAMEIVRAAVEADGDAAVKIDEIIEGAEHPNDRPGIIGLSGRAFFPLH